jgi:hypothetical protein
MTWCASLSPAQGAPTAVATARFSASMAKASCLGHSAAIRRITDPRGLSLDPSGTLIYLNSGEDRVLVLDHLGNTVRDSGQIPGLDPGGATFGPDGRYYVTIRRARTISAMPATLDRDPEPLLPAGVVPFPRGFGFGRDGRLYLASGVAPSGEGDNTILAFSFEPALHPRRLVADPELSPLDLTIAPNGHIVVASEFPFGAPDAVTTVREYDAATGRLCRACGPAAPAERPGACAARIAAPLETSFRLAARISPDSINDLHCARSSGGAVVERRHFQNRTPLVF